MTSGRCRARHGLAPYQLLAARGPSGARAATACGHSTTVVQPGRADLLLVAMTAPADDAVPPDFVQAGIYGHAMSEPDSDAIKRQAMADELHRIEESCKYSAQIQFEQTKQWRAVNLWLGLPASVLAAVAGATALADTAGRIAAGIIALVAAGFGAVLTTVNAAHRMNRASSAANAYLEIQTAARQAREIDLPTWELDEARAVLGELTARRDEQNKTAEPPNRRAYRRAQKNIASGGQSYAIDGKERV